MDFGAQAEQAAKSLHKKGETVIKGTNAQGIPHYVIPNMANVHFTGDKSSQALLQTAVDYLAAKARQHKPFDDAEKDFMRELFSSMYYGGIYKGYYEAALLADHYVTGDGATLYVNADVYRSSVIVQDTMKAMIAYVATTDYRAKDFMELSSGEARFHDSPQGKALKQKGQRNTDKQGYLLSGGVLLTEQGNARLKNTDHRFYLKMKLRRGSSQALMKNPKAWAQGQWDGATGWVAKTWDAGWEGNVQSATGIGAHDGPAPSTAALDADYVVTWRVDSRYDFEPFPTTDVTHLPLGQGLILKLPDGLSEYLTRIGVAKAFDHYSEW